MIDDIGFSDSSASIAVSGVLPRFAFEKAPDYKAISALQIRSKSSIDGKLESLNRHIEGWHDFARQERAQNLYRAGHLQPNKRPVGGHFQFLASNEYLVTPLEWFLFSRTTQGCMKRSKSDGFDNWRAFARRQRDQFIDRFKADDERFQFGTRVLWLILGAACAAIGLVLIMILMR
jgi:hypothetical protein